jgi:XTP/dITP diphosphohydrolase
MELVFASNNAHKLSEVRRIIGERYQVRSLADIGCTDEIPETADTLAGNALIKARWVKEHYGYDCFADDTGLMVDALDGAPGVYTARYAGEHCTPDDNVSKLLATLEGESNRAARFSTVVALITDAHGEELMEGTVEGEIATCRRGTDGFGYDPIFIPLGTDKTFAEMGPDAKNEISHRGRAIAKLCARLAEL